MELKTDDVEDIKDYRTILVVLSNVSAVSVKREWGKKTVEKPEEEIFIATTKATDKHLKWGAHYFKGRENVESAVALLVWREIG